MIHAFQLSYANENGLYKLAFSILLFAPLALMLGITPFDIALIAISLLFLVFSFQKHDFSWVRQSWVKILLLLWLYMIVRGLFAIEPQVSVFEAVIFVRFALFALALQYWLLKKSAAREALTIVIAITLLFSVIDGLIQLLTGSDLLGHSLPADFWHSWRLSAISGKLNLGAKFSMIALPAIMYLLSLFCKKERTTVYRWMALLLALALIMFVPITGERNATLMMLLGLGLMFLLYKSFRMPLLIIFISTALCMTALIHYSPGFKKRSASGVEVVSEIVDRHPDPANAYGNSYLALLKTDWNIFLENPIFGVGRKQYHTYCEQAPETIAITKAASNQCITNAQNVYFEWLDETGMVGFILFIAIVWALFNQFYLNRHLFLANPIALAVLIEIFLRLWPLASTSSFFFSWSGGPFWLMVGWGLSYIPTAILTDEFY